MINTNLKESNTVIVNEVAQKVFKEQFIDGLFQQKIKKYRRPNKDGQLIDAYLYPVNEGQQRLFNGLFQKYKGISPHSYQDFMNECAMLTFKAVNRFEIMNGNSWEGILDGSDKINVGKLMSSIRQTVQNDIIRFVNVNSKFTRFEGQNIIVNYPSESLNNRLDDGEGNSIENHEMIADSYWDVQEGYEKDFFLKWFMENRETILTKTQNDFLHKLTMCRHDSEYTENDIEAVTGVPSFKVNTKLARIEERALKAWEKAYPGSVKSMTDVEKEWQIELLNDFLILTQTFEHESYDVTEWISDRMDNDFLTNTFYDCLDSKDTQAWLQALRADTLIPYHVVAKMEQGAVQKVQTLNEWETEKVKFHVKHTDNRFDKLLHALHNARIREFKEQPCYVYDREGNLIRTEKHVPIKQNKTIIVDLMANGVTETEL